MSLVIFPSPVRNHIHTYRRAGGTCDGLHHVIFVITLFIGLNLGRHKPCFLSSSRLIQFCLSLSVYVCLQRAAIWAEWMSIREEVQHVLYYVHLNNSKHWDYGFRTFFGGGRGTFIFLCFILWVLPFLCSDCCEFASEWASKTRLFQCLITIATVIIVHLAPSFVYCVLNVLLVCWWVYKSLSCLLRSQLTPGQWLHMKTNFLDNSGTYKFMFY